MEDNFYQKFDDNNKSNSSVSKIAVPFISGMLGATLVVGTCFGVPSIKNKLLSNEVKPSSSAVTEVAGNPIQISLSNYSDTAIYAANKALPSIVGISISYNISYFGRTQTAEATGSGVIISNDGYILTNNHVVSSSDSSYYYEVSSATKVTVSLYGSDETYEATIVGTDEQTDLAIIKIDAEGLTAAELGDSSSVKVGEFVLAIGSPLGLDTSVTAGIVSALARDITTDDGTTYHVLQTDCAINSGNSGGALVNSQGQVIGINTLKLSGTGVEGVGFAIPINATIEVYEQLIEHGKVLRPYIGISGSNLSETTAKRYNLPVGVYVEDISENTGASNSDLKIGDVITEVDGEAIKTMDDLNAIKNKKKIGDTLKIKVYRSGEYINIEIILTEMP